MFILGGGRLGIDTLGGQVEAVKVQDRMNRASPLGSASVGFLRFFDDACFLLFPTGEDSGILEREVMAELSTSEAASGAREVAAFGRHDRIRLTIPDVSAGAFRDLLDTWLGQAQDGAEFAFGFDHTDAVFTSLEQAESVGATMIELENTEGIVPGRTYLLRRDTLGANATKNLVPNGGFNAGIANLSAFGGAVLSHDTAMKFEGAGSAKITTVGGGTGAFESVSPVPAKLGWMSASAMVLTEGSYTLRLEWVQDGTTVQKDVSRAGTGTWQATQVNALIPKRTITNLRVYVLSASGSPTIWVDALQLEQRYFGPTAFSDSGLTSFSAASSYAEEYVTVKEVLEGVGVRLVSPLKASYGVRDVFKSRRFWPRLVLIRADVLAQKVLTADFTVEAREVPS